MNSSDKISGDIINPRDLRNEVEAKAYAEKMGVSGIYCPSDNDIPPSGDMKDLGFYLGGNGR